jgi:hypothetical protein
MREMDLQDVHQLVSLGRGKDDVGSQALVHLGAIEVHAPICGVRSRRQVLVLSQVSEEIRQDLGLDRRPGLVLNGVSS